MMRIMVVSDSHKYNGGMQKIVMDEGPFDRVIHLGDSEIDEKSLKDIVKAPLDVVAGNCDIGLNYPGEKMINIAGHNILLTHGHRNGVTYGYERLIYHGLEKGADIIMFGHIHRPVMMETDGITLVNPGSISLPRQESRKPTWILMEVDDQGKIKFNFKEI